MQLPDYLKHDLVKCMVQVLTDEMTLSELSDAVDGIASEMREIEELTAEALRKWGLGRVVNASPAPEPVSRTDWGLATEQGDQEAQIGPDRPF